MGSERRRAPRQEIRWNGLIVDSAGSPLGRCTVVNVSNTGAKIVLKEKIEVPDTFVLMLSHNGGVRRYCDVAWRLEKSLGVRFVAAPSAENEMISHLKDTLARITAGG